MKKSFYFFLAALFAATISFSSCQKEEGAATGTTSLVIKLPGAPSSRVVEAPVDATAGSTIPLTSVDVFLMNGNSKVDVVSFDGTDLAAREKHIENVPARVNNVIVVANKGSLNTTFTPATLSTADEILKFPFTVGDVNHTAGIVDKVLLGQANVVDAGVEGGGDPHPGTNYKTATVTLKSPLARIEVGDVVAGEGIESIQLIGVWINNYWATNAGASTLAFNNDSSPYWYTASGSTGAGTSATSYGAIAPINAYAPSQYYDVRNAAVNTTATGSDIRAYAYQVFATDASASTSKPHVILLVKGEYSTGYFVGTNKYFLKYITIKGFKTSGSVAVPVVSNKIIKLGVGAAGIEVNADNLTDEPENQDYDLQLAVEVADWTVENVLPTF
jgi:hypothetical protein